MHQTTLVGHRVERAVLSGHADDKTVYFGALEGPRSQGTTSLDSSDFQILNVLGKLHIGNLTVSGGKASGDSRKVPRPIESLGYHKWIAQ